MKRRLIGLLAVFVLVLAACASSGAPETFEDQPGPLAESIAEFATELVGSDNPDQIPLVRRNFLEGCMLDGNLRIDGLSGAPLAEACGCSYDTIVGFIIDNPPADRTAFDTFRDLDNSLKDDGTVLSNQWADLLAESCGIGVES